MKIAAILSIFLAGLLLIGSSLIGIFAFHMMEGDHQDKLVKCSSRETISKL